MKDEIITSILEYLKNCDNEMKFIDSNKLLEMSDDPEKVIYFLKELGNRGYIDNQQIGISADGYIVLSDMHRPLLTDYGRTYLEENTK